MNVDYSRLVEVFGQPHIKHDAGDDKVQAEWCFEFEDGVLFTIYDWKNYQSVEHITDWHVGGFSGKDCELLDRVEVLIKSEELKGINTSPSPATRG